MQKSEQANPWPVIDRLMREHAVSARELADIAGVVPSAVMNWKQGRPIKTDSLFRIAVHFSVSVDYLLGRAPVSAPRSAEGAEQAPSLPPPAPSPRLIREPRAEYSAISPRSLESRVAFLETQCAAIAPQLDEIRTILISLLAEERRQHAPPLATPDRKEKVG
jgi:transcriptional regulator with XRE-family HTH domain